MNTPHIVTVSGPSLSGKTEFTKILQKEFDYNAVVSVTTRPRRSAETNNVDYYFITPEEYSNLKLIQKTDFNNYQYGVSENEVLTKTNKPILWVVAPQSIPQIENYCKENNFNITKIFITNPQEILFTRLFDRFKNDSNATIDTYVKRLNSIVNVESEWVKDAMSKNSTYDLTITEFTKETCYDKIHEALLLIDSKSNKTNVVSKKNDLIKI
jgi:guanylate kinase